MIIETHKINRIEVISENGREFVVYVDTADISIQDEGKTMKIFVLRNEQKDALEY
jgi:hypothetical protein